MCISSIEANYPDSAEVSPKLQQLPGQFAALFGKPSQLPPQREFDHGIKAQDGSKPVCIRPYRHSYHVKNEVERLIGEMLEEGLIRYKKSPYASPVIMVKKSDGTWRMCIDYRALDQLTIKDKFPIPVIDELLDELHGS